jgi:chemotaxis protein CheC
MNGFLPNGFEFQLTPQQQDALSELVNIGFGRAANALSMLVNQRVLLDAPQVQIVPTQHLGQVLVDLEKEEIINVHQVFRGKLAGDAMLLMDRKSASILVDMLSGGPGQVKSLSAEDREALVETGNILLNAFIGSFGNLLKVHITFTVPHLQVESLADMLNSLSQDGRAVEVALMLRIHFRLSQGDVSGYVIIVMGIQSMDSLLKAMTVEGFSF